MGFTIAMKVEYSSCETPGEPTFGGPLRSEAFHQLDDCQIAADLMYWKSGVLESQHPTSERAAPPSASFLYKTVHGCSRARMDLNLCVLNSRSFENIQFQNFDLPTQQLSWAIFIGPDLTNNSTQKLNMEPQQLAGGWTIV